MAKVNRCFLDQTLSPVSIGDLYFNSICNPDIVIYEIIHQLEPVDVAKK